MISRQSKGLNVASLASQLDGIFKPKSIAVIGASTRPGTVGNDLFRNLLFGGYQGCVYPVNPKAEHILGVHCFPSLSNVPSDVDLAVLIVPAKAVLGLIDEAKAKNVKGMIIISAGFKETGREGAELEKQVAAKVREAGIPLIGPNCLGVINAAPDVRMNATFATKIPAYGKLAFFSQSGALCTSVLDYAEARHIGFSKFISFGNKADVKEIDILEYLADDPETNTVAMYLEDISDGHKFIEIASKIFWEKKKPLICLKSGRSAEGAKAVSSHTGSLAGSDQVYNAIFTQCGVQRVNTISELFDYAALYMTQPMPQGNRLAIITNAGGPGIMATDAAVGCGLKLAEISETTKETLKPSLPAAASLHNPVDVIGDARSDRYEAATRLILEDPNVDMGMVILTPQSMTDVENIGGIIPKAVAGIDKPVVAAFMGARDVAPGVELLVKNGVPNYAFPESGITALGAAYRLIGLRELGDREFVKYNDCDVEKAKKIIADALGSVTGRIGSDSAGVTGRIGSDSAGANEKYMTQAECRPLFECYKLPLLKSGVAKSADEAAAIVKGIGRKVVMKVMSADVVHKFDAGGVILNVDGPDAAKATYDQIFKNVEAHVPGAKIDGILIEEMAAKGTEVIVGCNRDENFGPLMMFGLGGTLVEVPKDVTFRLAPMWKVSAERMVREIKAYQVLDGFRGTPKADVESIVDTILRISEMVTNHPEIAEMDINPLIVHAQGEGSSVADSRVLLRK
ncbi:MAG: acetate--CoA ligase family protein [Planctomycetaceae bacterium]|nr:acetate--CoA ligase family protein [Planctomycetaceae bacterium]